LATVNKFIFILISAVFCTALLMLLPAKVLNHINSVSVCPIEQKPMPTVDLELLTIIRHIENTVVLPPELQIEDYHRFYYIKEDNYYGLRIHAEYTIGVGPTSKYHIPLPTLDKAYLSHIDHIPLIMDGGCSVLHLAYDVKTQRFLSKGKTVIRSVLGETPDKEYNFDVTCNGQA